MLAARDRELPGLQETANNTIIQGQLGRARARELQLINSARPFKSGDLGVLGKDGRVGGPWVTSTTTRLSPVITIIPTS